MNTPLAKQMTAFLVAAWMAAHPAFGAGTDISNTPLGSAAGAGFLPNLLFILDDSGSMDRDYNPDYVNGNGGCMSNSGGNSDCQRGEPPFEAGGEHGYNGVSYDPNFTYLSGLSPNGQPVLNPPTGTLSTLATPRDAYLGGANVNITANITDRRYCNANGVCKRNGTINPRDGTTNDTNDASPTGGTDASGNVFGAGQFPYRTHLSNSSKQVFGLPEMMPIGAFKRRGTGLPNNIALVTTVGPHGLATGDTVLTNVTNLAVTCAPVTKLDDNHFSYVTGGTNNQNRTGSYRKCSAGSFSRNADVVSVTSANHGLVTGDIITTVVSNSGLNVTNRSVDVINADKFTYANTGANVTPDVTGDWVRTGLYNVASTINGPAVAYQITPIEYCTDPNLTDCIEVIPPATPPASHPFAAYVRFCRTQEEALAPGAVSFIATTPPTPRCQLKFVNTGTRYTFARYGWFTRDTIKPTVATYARGSARTDCAGVVSPPAAPAKPFCTYTEEIQNYAKWHAYYRNRMMMMKTAAGRAFLPFISNPTASPPKPDRLRVGFITINPGSPVDTVNKYLRIDNFNAAQATDWYTKFYAQVPNGFTPLREALSRAGWIFAGQLNSGLTDGIPTADDPVQASCQKNYSFLTTDGFWNQGVGQDLAGLPIGNLDNVDNYTVAPYAAPDFFSSRASGTYDGAVLSGTTAGSNPGGSGTLADVALYYYMTDLRGAGAGPSTSPSTTPPNEDVSKNDVLAKSGTVDFAFHQHMNTYTIGLADGLMRYDADYASLTTGDFANIRNAIPASGNCFWATGVCDWPSPQQNAQSALDDLWHAAVNGRGQFYSAVNPRALSTGLSGALNNFNTILASAAAAATSSPQVAQGNAKAFSTTYQTATWSGQVYAQAINPASGDVETGGPNNGKLWEAHKRLATRATPRVLKTFDVGGDAAPRSPGPTKLKDFAWGSLTPLEQMEFLNKCSHIPPYTSGTLGQCPSLTLPDQLVADDGSSLVEFLGGSSANEGTVFRDRTELDLVSGATVNTVLGDIVNAQPVAVSAPFFQYESESIPEAAGEDYPTFRTNQTARYANPGTPPPLLIGANDGFLHAFDPNNGDEMWAYSPRFLMPGLFQLADINYPGQHRFYVDGTPEVADVFDATAGVWKTIVVGGVNSGGRGYYALDITNPTDPRGLWEFCADPNWCPDDGAGPHSDPDLGFTYGNPVIGRRPTDGRWVVVVTSGLNNVSPGDGQGYFFVLDAITGEILNKFGTGVGDAISPSGLMKIGGYYPNGLSDPLFTYVYGGDQEGNVWRLHMSAPVPAVRRLAILKDASGRIQPITARPAGTHIGTTRIFYIGTGRYLGNSDLTDAGPGGIAWQQSIYGIRDRLSNPDDSENLAFTPAASFRSGNVVFQTLAPQGKNRTITRNAVDWATQDGFVIDLNPTFAGDPPEGNSPGERVFLDLRLIQGTLIVTSNVPEGGVCLPGGHSFQYGLDFRTGGYVGNDANAIAGLNLQQFLVGAAIEQTADNNIKALNKTITGENITTPIPIEIQFGGKRFSYRER